ncbi:MAG: hypothetical protein JSW60_07985 [Thermoplasmatales archaeon]|nr:MAG: hypothetical protein JSW60_07985 [Thermoplasmatales archaeon]
MRENLLGESLSLEPFQEVVGTLHAVIKNDTCIKLTFTCTREIELPAFAVSYKKLQPLIGSKIGILNVDDKFFVREI